MDTKIPLWITLFGSFLVLIGLYAGVACYTNVGSFIAGYTTDTIPHKYGAWEMGARNLSMALVMLLALISRHPRLIGLAFIMRVLTETQDMVIGAITGAMGMPTPVVIGVFVLLFIIPEAVCIWQLNKLASNASAS
jgi:hypothetical protein